tara:strand:+ start:86 stop:553 length:468 start_codon:yes stop_codon:yes gene_type:complete
MEQNNLIVTPDGKSWDEVTRDTSYLGNSCIYTETDSENTSNAVIVFNEWRGASADGNGIRMFHAKDWAIASDRVICLVAGQYRIEFKCVVSAGINASSWGTMKLNGLEVQNWWMQDENYGTEGGEQIFNLKRGDYIQIFSFARSTFSDHLIIHRI